MLDAATQNVAKEIEEIIEDPSTDLETLRLLEPMNKIVAVAFRTMTQLSEGTATPQQAHDHFKKMSDLIMRAAIEQQAIDKANRR